MNYKIGDQVRYIDEGQDADYFTVLGVPDDNHVILSLRDYPEVEQDSFTNIDKITL